MTLNEVNYGDNILIIIYRWVGNCIIYRVKATCSEKRAYSWSPINLNLFSGWIDIQGVHKVPFRLCRLITFPTYMLQICPWYQMKGEYHKFMLRTKKLIWFWNRTDIIKVNENATFRLEIGISWLSPPEMICL